MGKVLSVCISDVRGVAKRPVDSLHLVPNHGIEGDAHAGNWHRQVSLLAQESVDTLQSKITLKLKPGDFAENVLTEGIELKSLPIGTHLKMGTALGEVTQIGKECHNDCAIRRQVGDCVMPREGIFVRILEEGILKPGDEITVVD